VVHKIKGLMLMAQTPEEACNIVAIRRKTKGINPRHNQLWFNFCNCASGTHPIKDVVIVTPHTTGVLIAIVCIRKPLEGGGGVATKKRA
jgi:hypothetical protein